MTDEEVISGNLSPVQPDAPYPFMLLSTLPTMLPKLGQNRVPPLAAGPQLQVSSLRTIREGRLGTSFHEYQSQVIRRSVLSLFFSHHVKR